MRCKNCGYEGPYEDFQYPEVEGDITTSYYFKCPKCKTKIDPYNLDPSRMSDVSFVDFRCPFCGVVLEEREMQFHVGIPLCMELRKRKGKQVELKAAIGGTFPVPALDYEYFGNRGIRDLMSYTIQRHTMGHPDEGKPIKLEEFVDHSED